MRRTAAIALALLLSGASLAAEIFPSLAPKDATSMALGGCFTSIPTAQFSFFGNPAAFAAPKGSLTLIYTDAWAYIKPTSSNISSFANALKGSNSLGAIAGLMPANGGIGGGASVGLGYAGRGLGLGLFATSDEYAAGDSIPGAVLDSDTEVSAVIGLGLPIKLLGTTVSLGGDLRPFYRVLAGESLADVVNGLASSGGGDSQTSVLDKPGVVEAGFGLAMDLGAAVQLGSFGIGFSIRDISPSFSVWTGSFQELFSSLGKGTLPDAGRNSNTAIFAPDLSVGMSWKPRLFPGFVDPALYLELQDPVWVAQNWDGIGSAFNLLHAGAEIKLLNLITLRGGINRGWLSAGAGLKLLFLDIDAAVFTEELGALPGDDPRSGLALQAAIRF